MNPKFIAICGRPTSGKSEAQRLLHNALGYVPVDDGRPPRQIAIDYLGLTEEQVTTQAGKAETVTINGKDWVVRDVLGEIGNAFECKFGGDVIPLMALNHYKILQGVNAAGYSFGSVRRKQGHFYRSHGGMVIEIVRPGVEPSPYAFDQYDPTAVDVTVLNDGSLLQLEDRLCAAINDWNRRDTGAYGGYSVGEIGDAYASPND